MQATGHNLNTVLLDAPEAIYILDHHGFVIGFNSLAGELFGAGKLSVGVCISNLLTSTEKADYEQTLNECIAQKSGLFSIEFKLERNGQTLVIEQRTKLIHENGLPIRLVASVRDITETFVNRKLFDRSEIGRAHV